MSDVPRLYLEDFAPGQRFISEPTRITVSDLQAFAAISGDRHPLHLPDGPDPAGPMVHGPLAIARYYGSVFDSGLLLDSLVGALDVQWRFLAPLRVDVPFHYETLVTGWRRSRSNPTQGIVFRTVWLKSEEGEALQEGTSAVVVRAARADGDDDPASSLPLGMSWARALVAHLEDSAEFHDATQLFDGTIGLASDISEVQLRIYKGQVIDVAQRTPRGPTFVLRAAAHQWCELLGAPRNDFVVRTNRGDFSATGDGYVYLQLTKALHLLVDAAREIHRTAEPSNTAGELA